MKLIALDLDGTLLNSEKVISAGNFAALSLAAEQGHVIVPATGRALRAIPEQVMALPFLRYAITINGAKVSDTRTGETLLRAELALDTCLRLMDFAGRYDTMYDCYWNDTGWVDRAFLERVRYYNADEEVVALLRRTRAPVEDLKAFVRANGQPVQKVQLCFRDMAERETARAEITAAFPDVLVTSSFRTTSSLMPLMQTRVGPCLHSRSTWASRRRTRLPLGTAPTTCGCCVPPAQALPWAMLRQRCALSVTT